MKVKSIFLFFLISVFLTAQEKSDFEYKLNIGDEFKREFKSLYSVDMNSNMSIQLLYGGEIHYKVIRKENQNNILTVKYDSLFVSMVIPGGQPLNVSSDSLHSTAEIPVTFYKILSKLKNKEFEAVFSKNGSVLEVRGFRESLEKVFSEAISNKDTQSEKVKETIYRYFGGNSFKDNHQFLVQERKNKLSINKQWNQNIKMGENDSLKIQSKLQLNKKDKNYYYVEGKSVLEFNESKQMQNKSVGLMKSNYKIDRKSGWIVEGVFNQVSASEVPEEFRDLDLNHKHDEESHEEEKKEEVEKNPMHISRKFVLMFKQIDTN